MLGLICKTFSSTVSVSVRKLLYLTLVRSRLLYCSVVWRPYSIRILFFLKECKGQPLGLYLMTFILVKNTIDFAWSSCIVNDSGTQRHCRFS